MRDQTHVTGTFLSQVTSHQLYFKEWVLHLFYLKAWNN